MRETTSAAALPALLLRYAVVGGALAAIYAALTAALIELHAWPALSASVAAFCASLPVAYLGHRYATFRPGGGDRLYLHRFVLAMSLAFGVTTASVAVFVNAYGAHYTLALAVSTVLVPSVNFVVLRQWVFRRS